jgi:hypothetical protein
MPGAWSRARGPRDACSGMPRLDAPYAAGYNAKGQAYN